MFLVSSCSCLCPIKHSQVSSREWRCSWSSADKRCSNYIWVIDNFIAYWGTTYIRELTVKLTFEMLTVHGQQHSFLTYERVFLWKCQSFWDRKFLDLRGTRTSNLRIHAECSNLLRYQAKHLLSHVSEHWLWRYRYFWSKVNIWNVNCARATAFIFDTQTGVLVKVSKSFWDRKCLDLRGTRTPNLRIHAVCSNLLSYQGQTFGVPCFSTLALVV